MSLNSEGDKNDIDEIDCADNKHKLSFIISKETAIDTKSQFANDDQCKRHATRKMKV